ncbi:MGT family glycosyltransferase [Actinokineospora spheciospongiae]|nr:MGT family glycosyltransferase [Actinokineospora spheciospongiae]
MPYPAFGHISPLLPVVGELAARGARVRVVADHRYSTVLAAAGAEVLVLPVAADVFFPARVGGAGTVRYLRGRVRKRVVGWHAARLVAAESAVDRGELVVVDPMMAAVDRFVLRAGIRSALFSTTYLRRGIPGGDRVVLVNSIAALQPAPMPRAGHVHFVGPLIRQERGGGLSRFGLPTHKRVLLVSPGTVFARAPGYFREVAWAFAGSSWWVVVATGAVDPATLGSLPSNVVAVRRVPQVEVLAHCAVFVTHGGMNSALEALTLGVPMVVSPRAGDQHHIARRLVEWGVAAYLPTSGSAIRRSVERMASDPRVRAAADRWRARLSGGRSVAEAADLLLAQAGG